MNPRRFLGRSLLGTALFALWACSDSTPTSPTALTVASPAAPTVADSASWVGEPAGVTSITSSDSLGMRVPLAASVTQSVTHDERQPGCHGLKAIPPGVVSPAGGIVIGRGNVVLTARNAAWRHADEVPGIASLPFTYRFELYEGAAQTPSLVRAEQQGADGTTTHTVAERFLSDDTAYRWQVRAEHGGHACVSEVARFRTRPGTLGAPTPISPPNGAKGVPLPVRLRVENGAATGNVGAVTIRFEVAPTPAFRADEILRIPPVPAGNRYTSVSVPGNLTAPATTYHWRARALGARGIRSEYSRPRSFTTAERPAPGGGDAIDPSTVRWLHTNVTRWPQTSTITDIRIRDVPAGGICIEHTQSGSWPGVNGKLGSFVAGNAWVFANIGGTWYGATYDWLRPGQICKLTVAGKHDRPSVELGPHTKQPPVQGWVPRSGEQVGFMVSTLARFGPEGNRQERSNIVVVTWP